ncbi:MAG: cell surface protein [Verrucomicrobia bacterium]|jgi:hypothetical protein|nr:cell surface protein [Verrucomicrobiota bacterium]
MKKATARNLLFLVPIVLLLSACRTTFQDYTPERIPQNPSGIYTFSFTADLPNTNIVEGTPEAYIVINNERHQMEKVPGQDLSFSYDYKMPPGVTEARYYYELTYDYGSAGQVESSTKYSTHEAGRIYTARLINRYPIQLVNDRGPAGSRIPIVGNGFTNQDVVVVGGVETATTVHSSNSLEFTVPALPAGQAYPVVLRTGSGDLKAGTFRVDEAAFRVQPPQISLQRGETDLLIVEVDNPAPAGGLYVEAQTDVPESVIIPEIIVPAGARSVNVNVTGGEPGEGILILSIPGYAPLEVPVTVR